MTTRNEQLDCLIAAFQFLRTLPAGAENEPDQRSAHALTAATFGRSGTGLPHPATDRPAPIEFERLARENALMAQHLDVLASALGACGNCWGTLHDCEECHGFGKPGGLSPDQEMFDRYVLPVLTRVMGESPLHPDIR
ncbi:hypothetical protein FNJ84_04400 [Paracoccus sp. M683]|uniref:hypothetical protein n=1 Tax=Paracoccus sp. M683 TaxID=2594268 RepID=UPI00117E0211|nr:hypothetical protein [Paracoccus sp. M683]TRW98801.1 hypothetical protein FNJ84_04400 [Paracoccus sp. M683]